MSGCACAQLPRKPLRYEKPPGDDGCEEILMSWIPGEIEEEIPDSEGSDESETPDVSFTKAVVSRQKMQSCIL